MANLKVKAEDGTEATVKIENGKLKLDVPAPKGMTIKEIQLRYKNKGVVGICNGCHGVTSAIGNFI